MRLIRLDGFEAESRMPFAAVQRLTLSLRELVPALPEREQKALDVASGRSAGPPPDRFLVGLGVLGLLASAGEQTPVVCTVDDAHLLDSESLDVLAFVARRLEAESVALLLAARDAPHLDLQLAGAPTLRLVGLDLEWAMKVISASLPGSIDPAVAVQIARAAGGNPLALTDLASELTVRQLTESSLGEEPFPVGRHLEAFYLRRVRRLDEDAQTWLLVAAADSTGERRRRGPGRRGAGSSPGRSRRRRVRRTGHARDDRAVPAPARAGGGVQRGGGRHAASGAPRALGGRGLARHGRQGCLARGQGDVGHRRDGGCPPGERGRPGRRAGRIASRASVLAQASTLTPPGADKYRRLVAAAEAALAAGTSQLAKDLLNDVDDDALDDVSRGRLMALSAHLALFTADPALTRGPELMLSAAALFHGHDVALEQRTLVGAWEMLLPAERLMEGTTWQELGERLAAGAALRSGTASVILHGLSAHLLLPYAQAVPAMRAAVDLIADLPAQELLDYGHSSVALATALWDEVARRRCLERWAQAARDSGSLQPLDNALWVLSLTETVVGNARAASEYIDQVRELRRAIGYDAEHVVNVALLAWTGVPRDQVVAMADGAALPGPRRRALQRDGGGGRHGSGPVGLRVCVRDPEALRRPRLLPHHAAGLSGLHRGRRADRSHRRGLVVVGAAEERALASGSPFAQGPGRPRTGGAVPTTTPRNGTTRRPSPSSAPRRSSRSWVARTSVYGEWLRRASGGRMPRSSCARRPTSSTG